jgi:hypothetical protein
VKVEMVYLQELVVILYTMLAVAQVAVVMEGIQDRLVD